MNTHYRKLQDPPIDATAKELDRSWLVPILNGDSPDVIGPASRRVLRLLKDLLLLDHLRSELARRKGRQQSGLNHGWPRYQFGGTEAETIDREGQRLLVSINLGLKRYRWHPIVFLSSFNDSARYSFDSGANTEAEHQENLAVETLLDYVSEDKIGLFRRCTVCSRWFIAATEHQKYCSTKCRVRNHSESEEFKRKRARYMRLKYRVKHKTAEEAVLKDGNELPFRRNRPDA